MTATARSTLLRYASAVLAVALGTIARLALDPILGDLFPFATLFFAVLLVAGYAGRGPALLATGLGALASARFLLPPRGSIAVRGFEHQAGLVLYLTVGVGIALLGGALRGATRRAEASADEAGRQREELRATLTGIGDAVIVTDAEGRVTAMNPVAEALTGWSASEAAGQPLVAVFTIIDEASRRPVEDPALRAVAEGTIVGLANHTVLVARDGAERPIDDSAAPIRDGDGRAVGAVLVFRDVSQRRQAERELRRRADELAVANSHLEAVFGAVNEGIVVFDPQGNVVYCNAAEARICGYDSVEQMRRHLSYFAEVFELSAPDGLVIPVDRWPVSRVLRGERVVDWEIHGRRRDTGQEWDFSFAGNPVHAADGRQVLSVLVTRDITRQKRAEEALRASEAWFRRLADTMPQVVWTATPDGSVDYFNARWYEYTGSTPEASLHEGWRAVVHPDDLPRLSAVRDRGLGEGEVFEAEVRLRRRDGAYRWHLVRSIPVGDEAGRLARRFGAATDIDDRRRAEEALRESERQYRAVYDQAAVGITEVDLSGRFLRANDRYCEIVGYSQEELLGLRFGDLTHPNDPPAHWEQFARIAEGPSSYTIEKRYVRKDGRVVWARTAVSLIRDGTGRPERVVAVVEDITERVRAEEALRESEERFVRFMQHLPGLAWIKDSQDRYVFANDAAVRAFRRRREELYGKTDGEVFPAETAVQFRENDRRALTSEAGVQVVEALEQDDGLVHHSIVSKFPIPGHGGRPAFVGGVAIDITDLKRAEEALRESEEQFRSLAEGMPHFVWVCDALGRNLYQNSVWYDYTGTPPGSGHDREWIDQYHPEDRPRLVEEWAEALRTDGSHAYDIEARIRRHDGAYRWFRVKGSPIRDGDGTTVRWVGTCTDIHEQRRLVDALREADRRKDEFLATLAHELRNPLAPIRTALHLMRHSGEAGVRFEAERAMAERQVVHLARLVDDLMDVARISKGKIDLRKEVIELAPVMGRVVEALGPSIEGRGHALSVSLPAEPIRLEADPTRLEQVLWNLLSNAAKYTEPGGRIRLEARQGQGEVAIRVRDTGVGIEPEMLPRIFGMFVQAGPHRGHSQGGLGIGLGLVKSLVEGHGGTIEAHSGGPGTGSEFVVRLPVLPATSPERVPPGGDRRRDTEVALPRRRILVVDDNVDAAVSLSQLLTLLHGQEVRVAHDGPSALQTADEFRPEVVLLDIGLPGMSGHEVASKLRQRSWSGGSVLVAVTGWGQERDRRESRRAGFDYHFVKPVAPEAIRGLLTGDLRQPE